MARPGRQSFEKRAREKKKKDKAQEKLERKAQRKADKESGLIDDGDVDYSLATTNPDGTPLYREGEFQPDMGTDEEGEDGAAEATEANPPATDS